MSDFSKFAGGFLEVCVLSGGGEEDAFGDLFVSIDAGVLWVMGGVLRRPP